MTICPHCQNTANQSRAGTSQGRQRYHCGSCGRRYTERGTVRGYPEEIRLKAKALHADGIGVRQIARELKVNHQSVANWIRSPAELDTSVAAESFPIIAQSQMAKPQTSASGGKRATIADVAHQAGVSVSSVSNFLNEKGHLGAETHQRIKETIADLQFTPSGLMRAIRRRRTRIIGVLMHGLSNIDENVGKSVTPPLLAGILREATVLDYNVLLYPKLLYNLKTDESLTLLDGHIDGLIWFSPPVHEPVLDRVARACLPTIALLTRHVPDGVGYVNTDNVAAVRESVAHLARLGHRRIAYLGARNQSNFIDRRAGYLAGLAAEGLPRIVALEVGLSETWKPADIAKVVGHWRLLSDPPTAVVAATDSIAQEVVSAALAFGLSVPEDLSVIGFDDIPNAASIGGGLSTIRQPFRQVALLAVERLAALIEGASVESCRVTIQCELIVRSTTSPIHTTGHSS